MYRCPSWFHICAVLIGRNRMIYNLRIERGIRSPNGLTTPIGACHLEPDGHSHRYSSRYQYTPRADFDLHLGGMNSLHTKRLCYKGRNTNDDPEGDSRKGCISWLRLKYTR